MEILNILMSLDGIEDWNPEGRNSENIAKGVYQPIVPASVELAPAIVLFDIAVGCSLGILINFAKG